MSSSATVFRPLLALVVALLGTPLMAVEVGDNAKHNASSKPQADAYDSAMLYVSDHGESLGENNLYLHGLPYALAPDTQTHVPMISWLSDAMRDRLGLRSDCLKTRAADKLSHDNLFHAMLGLLDVKTDLYRKDLDWFAACR